MLFQRWVYHPVDPCLWWILTNTHWSSHEQSGQIFYEWSHLRDTKWLSWYDFLPECVKFRCFWDWEIKVGKRSKNFRKDFQFFGIQGECFFHTLRIHRICHEWEKYVPVHELDSSCKKSSCPCDGPRTVRILYTYWSNFANLNDNAFRSFSSSVTITGWP